MLSIKYFVTFMLPILGIFLIIDGIVLAIVSNFNLGIVLSIIFGVVMVLYHKINLKWFRRTIAGIMIFVSALSIFVCVFGSFDTADYKEDAVIVLGAGIRGETVTKVLELRLDKAYEMWEKNNDVVIIVSGGQGIQEKITEALAMERFLIAKGIPAENIIKEEKATSTYENFEFSKNILESKFGKDYKAAYITNDFHIYRAGLIARRMGLNFSHLHANQQWYVVPANCLREAFAVMKTWVFG